MKLFKLFGKPVKDEQVQKPASLEDYGVYSGMRVEVLDDKNQLLFIAKLMDLQENVAKLHEYSESEFSFEEEKMKVMIRGYNASDKKVIYMDGILTPAADGIWPIEELTFVKSGNDRAFFRLGMNVDGSMVRIGKIGAEEESCIVVNVSVGGACIKTDSALEIGDKLLLRVKLHPERGISVIFSEVCRKIEKAGSAVEYGCKFIELNEADQKQILLAIFENQRRKRG